jgi:hypothetical protein
MHYVHLRRGFLSTLPNSAQVSIVRFGAPALADRACRWGFAGDLDHGVALERLSLIDAGARRYPRKHLPAEDATETDHQKGRSNVPYRDHDRGFNVITQRQARRRDRRDGETAREDDWGWTQRGRVTQHEQHRKR